MGGLLMARTAYDEHFGGSVDLGITARYDLPYPSGVPGSSKMHVIRPSIAGLDVYLPDATAIPQAVGGDPCFTILNLGTWALDIVTSGGSLFTTLNVGDAVQIMLLDGSTSDGVLVARSSVVSTPGPSIPTNVVNFFLTLQSGLDTNIRDLCDLQGYDGVTPARVFALLSVPVGGSIALLGASSTSASALTTGLFPSGSSVTLTIGAGCYVTGKGGAGGNGAPLSGSPTNGQNGGVAMSVLAPMTLFNYGSILGGGGGGAGDATVAATNYALGGGGGGGSGYGISSGGSSSNTSATGGSGGLQSGGFGGTTVSGVASGGAGGAAGAAGTTATYGTATAGAGGAAIVVYTSGMGSLTKSVAGTITGAESTA